MRQGWKGCFAILPDYASEVNGELDGAKVVAVFGERAELWL
jgi:hypothetical protein